MKPMMFHGMRWLLVLGGLMVWCMVPSGACAGSSGQGLIRTYPKIGGPKKGEKAALIRRGEYLTRAGDCLACHTKRHGRSFAGGLPIKTPFGTFYSPNITPDRETGIGKWTVKQFIKSMHQGVRPDGKAHFPVYPYLQFTRVYRDDLIAIKAYLEAIPAVYQKNHKHDVSWPFNWRFTQWVWRFFFFKSGEFKPDPHRTPQWNRGAYLVQGLGHCTSCHTPINLLGGLKKAYFLGGSDVSGMFAPDITRRRLKHHSTRQILNVFTKDQLLGGHNVKVVGPMYEVNHNSLRYLRTDDLKAIVTYLKTVSSRKVPPKKIVKGSGQGRSVYENYCASCHNNGAGGAPLFDDVADWSARIKKQGGSGILVANAVSGYNAMPARGNCGSCTDEEIASAVQYILKHIRYRKAEPSIRRSKPGSRLTPDGGRRLYKKVCAVCHEKGQLGAPKVDDWPAWRPRLQQNFDVLFRHAIDGIRSMPARGTCYYCTDEEIIAAMKYMLSRARPQGDYRLW